MAELPKRQKYVTGGSNPTKKEPEKTVREAKQQKNKPVAKKTAAGKVDTTANLKSRSDIYLLSQQANRVRQGLLKNIKEEKTDFDMVLKIAASQRPIARMRMSRIMKAFGWKKRHFTIAINVLKLPVDNRLEWWIKEKNSKHLKKLKNYYENGELRESVSEKFPWSN